MPLSRKTESLLKLILSTRTLSDGAEFVTTNGGEIGKIQTGHPTLQHGNTLHILD